MLNGGYSYASMSDKISDIVLTPADALGLGRRLRALLGADAAASRRDGYLFYKGVGIWGVNVPVAWAFALTNFVWWVGIGHAGTFISAFLLLLRQKWRTSINRFAEAMTIFAVAMAGLMPILHLGRPWFFYWLIPYPDIDERLAAVAQPAGLGHLRHRHLHHRVDPVLVHGPDPRPRDACATAPQAAARQIVYGLFALGWRGEARHWQRFETAYLLMAGLATPLVISVHSVVSLDFSIGNTPGWHSTIFPPYFVAGALFSGFAMALTHRDSAARDLRPEGFHHRCAISTTSARCMLVCGLIVAYSYVIEIFMAFYSGDEFETYMILNRMRGPYAPIYWIVILFNVVLPQALWFERVAAERRRRCSCCRSWSTSACGSSAS